MLKEIETEETIIFFVTLLSLVAFQLKDGAALPPPLATPMPIPFLNSTAVQVLGVVFFDDLI